MLAGAISTAVVFLGSKAKLGPTIHWLSLMVGSFSILQLTHEKIYEANMES